MRCGIFLLLLGTFPIATMASASPPPSDVFEAKQSLIDAGAKGMAKMDEERRYDPAWTNFPHANKIAMGTWLASAYSMGMCSSYVAKELDERWHSMAAAIVAPFGQRAPSYEVDMWEQGGNMKRAGQQEIEGMKLSAAKLDHFCAIEIEAVRQALDEINL